MGLIYFVKLLRQVPLTDDQKKEVLKMDKTIGPTKRRSYVMRLIGQSELIGQSLLFHFE